MCFKPKDVPSKKVVLVELERAKVGLEQENSALKLKLKDLQVSAARATKDRDVLSCQRAELESQLQQRSSHASHFLTQVTCLRSDLTSRLQELLDQHLAAAAQADDTKAKAETGNKVNVHIVQPEYIDDELCGEGEAAAAADESTAQKVASHPQPPRAQVPIGSVDDATPGCPDMKLSLQEQLDRELETLAQAHQRAVEQAVQLQAQLRQADSDRAGLRTDVACARRRLEQTEANAADQQQVLQLRCAALEQENEQLTGMNEEMQQRLEGVQGDLSVAKKQWSSDGTQLAKQAAELEATNGRLREADAELRALQGKLAAATAQAQEANEKGIELQEQAAARASSLEVACCTLAAREAELAAAVEEVRQLQVQVTQHQQARDELAVQLRDATESARDQQREMTESQKLAAEALADARSQLTDVRSQLADAQRQLATAQQQSAVQTQALTDSNAQLLESRAALAATGDRLSRALEELEASESRATGANSQYLNTKQSVISTAKQLASMAKDHSANLAKLHTLEAEVTSLREQLTTTCTAEAGLRAQAEAKGIAAREAREAADASGAEARRLRLAYDSASADLRRKIMLLTAIARMADKGQAGAGGGRSRDGQAADPADGYGAVTSEQRLRLKICESPLPLLGALTAGIMDSSRLRHLALDMDTSREVTWEKAGLRICCLAAAIGLNNSLQTLQLGGWTWGELGNGTALPFLALGGGGGAGVAGGMLRSVQLATNLFDLEAAAMLKDLLAAGLVELAAAAGEGEEGGSSQRPPGNGAGQGLLYLYSGNERLDIWYRDMLLLADRRSSSGGSDGGSATAGTAARTVGPPSATSTRAGGAPLTHSHSASSVALSVTSAIDDPRTSAGSCNAPSTASFSSATTNPAPPPLPVAAAAATAAVDCDLSSEALESHHMILVMTVLLTCPGMKRLRLDGNKLGDGGAALLALGLAANTGLRELYLSRNGIRAAGARSLARCLEGANSTLLRLDLASQRQLEGIGAAGAEAMAQALRVNRTLEDLNLSSCGLGGAAAACFAGAIRAAGALRPQTPRSGVALPAGGGGSSGGGGCLRRLALSSNNIDSATSKALLAAAAERPGLAVSL